LLLGAHHKLDNLTAIVDYNNLQSLTTVAATLGMEPLAAKARAFGWTVHDVDGHDHLALAGALSREQVTAGMPTLVIARTTKGKGVSFMENQVAWHYKNPTADQLAQAKIELDGAAQDA
jgi:transketolase